MKKLKRDLLISRILLILGAIMAGFLFNVHVAGLIAGIVVLIAGGAYMWITYKCPHCSHPLNPKEDYLSKCPKCKQPFGE